MFLSLLFQILFLTALVFSILSQLTPLSAPLVLGGFALRGTPAIGRTSGSPLRLQLGPGCCREEALELPSCIIAALVS